MTDSPDAAGASAATPPGTSASVPAAPPHLTLDELADVLAGERTDAHLAGCAPCTARLGELRAADVAVASTLSALPAPAVPPGLADRLQSALSAEPALRAASADAGPATVTPLVARRDVRRTRSWVPAAAASAVLLLGGAIGWSAVQGGTGGSDETASGASDTAAEAGGTAGLPTSATGIDYGDPAQVASSLPAVLEGGDAQMLAADRSSEAAPGGAAATAADPLARLRDPAALADCLAALAPPENPAEQPLALDYASYRGTPGLAVVLPDPDPTKVSVFVVGAACSQANDATLYFVRADRP